jgi:hypothetical protein
MKQFWDLFKQSVIIQSLVTVILIGVYAYQVVRGQPTPDTFINIMMIVIGFWFGSKVGYSQGQNDTLSKK